MMRSLLGAAAVVTFFSYGVLGQTKPKSTRFPAGVPVKETSVEGLGGKVNDRTYHNHRFDIEFTVPDTWFIAGNEFEKVLKDNGHDLSVDPAASRSARQIDVLVTAFRSQAGRQGAILRVTSEDLQTNPQIRDAVDYFDAITAAYSTSRLPPDFSYSATKAEKLGPHQFAYLDTSSASGRKRLYATVIKRFAIMFTLSYTNEKDLQVLREVLSNGDFRKNSFHNRIVLKR